MTDRATTVSSYTASAGAVLLGMTSDQWSIVAIIAGIVTGLATFGLNAWFQWDRRQREIALTKKE